MISHLVNVVWNQRWKTNLTGRFMFGLKPTVPSLWKFNVSKRLDQSILDQARMGSALLNHRKYRFNMHPDGLCQHCMVPEDMVHFVLDCREKSSASAAIRGEMKLLSSEYIPFGIGELLDIPRYCKIVIKALRNRLISL